MSTRYVSWRRVGLVLVSTVIGVLGLVMWSSSSASALDASPPVAAPASLSAGVDELLDQVTTPVDGLLAPMGVDLAPVLDPVTEDLLDPTVRGLAPVIPSLPGPGLPPLPGVPALPDIQVAEPDAAIDETSVPPRIDDPAVGGTTPDRGLAVTSVSHAPTIDPTGSSIGAEPWSIQDSSTPDPPLPTSAPLLQAALGSLSSAGQGSTGVVLLAVLGGVVAVAASARSRRLALGEALRPRALAYAVVTPPG